MSYHDRATDPWPGKCSRREEPPDHAAAVEGVRADLQTFILPKESPEFWRSRCVTLLRAYEAVVGRQGAESWRVCGHVAWGTCSTCYVERGLELSRTEKELTTLRAQHAALVKGLSTHHEVDQGDLGRSCLPTCWVCKLLATLGEPEGA